MTERLNDEFGKSVLVVAAHPDDEVLGCGGTIARHADVGDQVQILVVAEGSTSRQQTRDRDQVLDEFHPLLNLRKYLDQSWCSWGGSPPSS